MNIRAKSEKGFSLIELLVVVAIIGVLAAVGVVGYQGYIDSTKQSVAESNSKAVHQWILNTKTVRAAGIAVTPSSCNTTGSSFDATACFGNSSGGASGIAGSGGPFEGFKNPYTTAQVGASAIRGTASASVSSSSACFTGHDKGDIVVKYSTASGLPVTLDVFYCNNDTTYAQKETTSITWE